KLWVSGLCNEEFASSLWQFDFPFNQKTKSGVTLEIFHGAHGAFETHAPIRTLLPVKLKGQTSLLAAYLCTPFVQFSEEQLKSGGHVKGRTLGEFGSGNYPLEMLQYNKKGEPRVLLVNSNLPMMVLPLNKLAEFEGSITEKPTSYAAGFPYEIRSGAGVLQADNYSDDYLVILQRNPNGSLDLGLMETRRL
ncbi:MAG: hypothetical protein H6510_08310, partial [Acidobacteria bacterium]|nr:hypothetical protein [Acidobacteriota bacterium]